MRETGQKSCEVTTIDDTQQKTTTTKTFTDRYTRTQRYFISTAHKKRTAAAVVNARARDARALARGIIINKHKGI